MPVITTPLGVQLPFSDSLSGKELQDAIYEFRGKHPEYFVATGGESEGTGFFRGTADVALGVEKGIIQGIRMMADVAGADNPVSELLRGGEDYLASLLSAGAQQDAQKVAQIMKAAEDKGLGANLKAAMEAISVAPLDLLAQAFGTMAPTVAAVAATGGTAAGPIAARVVGMGVGALQGTGIVKGTIYDSVKQEMLAAGIDESAANEAATKAQAYGGKNLDQILMGTLLGGAAGSTGVESMLATVAALKGGILRRATRGFVAEGVPEAAQAFQEQVAGNVALQRGGRDDVPTYRGATGSAALEGVLGGVIGGGFGVVNPGEADVEAQRGAPPSPTAAPKVDPNFVDNLPPPPTPLGDVEGQPTAGLQAIAPAPYTPALDVASPPGFPTSSNMVSDILRVPVERAPKSAFDRDAFSGPNRPLNQGAAERRAANVPTSTLSDAQLVDKHFGRGTYNSLSEEARGDFIALAKKREAPVAAKDKQGIEPTPYNPPSTDTAVSPSAFTPNTGFPTSSSSVSDISRTPVSQLPDSMFDRDTFVGPNQPLNPGAAERRAANAPPPTPERYQRLERTPYVDSKQGLVPFRLDAEAMNEQSINAEQEPSDFRVPVGSNEERDWRNRVALGTAGQESEYQLPIERLYEDPEASQARQQAFDKAQKGQVTPQGKGLALDLMGRQSQDQIAARKQADENRAVADRAQATGLRQAGGDVDPYNDFTPYKELESLGIPKAAPVAQQAPAPVATQPEAKPAPEPIKAKTKANTIVEVAADKANNPDLSKKEQKAAVLATEALGHVRSRLADGLPNPENLPIWFRLFTHDAVVFMMEDIVRIADPIYRKTRAIELLQLVNIIKTTPVYIEEAVGNETAVTRNRELTLKEEREAKARKNKAKELATAKKRDAIEMSKRADFIANSLDRIEEIILGDPELEISPTYPIDPLNPHLGAREVLSVVGELRNLPPTDEVVLYIDRLTAELNREASYPRLKQRFAKIVAFMDKVKNEKIDRYLKNQGVPLDNTLARERAWEQISNDVENLKDLHPQDSDIEMSYNELVNRLRDLMGWAKKGIIRSAQAQPTSQFVGRPMPRTIMNTVQEAIAWVTENGTGFEKLLAKKLLPFLKGVELVVVDDINAVPEDIRQKVSESAGMYVQHDDGSTTIYMNTNMGPEGLASSTFLHEALHAATQGKIQAYIDGSAPMDEISRNAVRDLEGVMHQAIKHFIAQSAAGKVPKEISTLHAYGAFDNLHEFMSYAMSHPDMQLFLQNMPSNETNARGFFHKIIEAIRKLFGIAPQFRSGMEQVVAITDALLSTPRFDLPPSKMILQSKAESKSYDEVTHDAIAKSARAAAMRNKSWGLKPDFKKDYLSNIPTALLYGAVNVLPTMDLLRMADSFASEFSKKMKKDGWGKWNESLDRMAKNLHKVSNYVDDMGKYTSRRMEDANVVNEFMSAFKKQFGRKADKEFGELAYTSTIMQINFKANRSLEQALNTSKTSGDSILHKSRGALAQLKKKAGKLKVGSKEYTNNLREQALLDIEIDTRKKGLQEAYARWKTLNKETQGGAQQLYDAMFNKYAETYKEHMALLEKHIEDLQISDKAKKNILAQLVESFQKENALEVYFPLRRYGQFWVRWGEGETTEFYMFESAGDRNAFVQEVFEDMAKEQYPGEDVKEKADQIFSGMGVKVGNKLENAGISGLQASRTLTEIAHAIENVESLGDDGKKELMDTVYQLYLTSLPTEDIRRRFQEREGKPGFSLDYQRDFQASQATSSNQLGRLKYATKIRLGLDSASNALDGTPKEIQTRGAVFVDNMRDRMKSEISTEDMTTMRRLAAKGRTFVFYYMLTSIRSAVTQLTQVPVVVLPVMQARYGNAGTTKLMGYMQTLSMFGNLDGSPSRAELQRIGIDPDGVLKPVWRDPDMRKTKYIQKHKYKDALMQAYDLASREGTFMNTYAMDMTAQSHLASDSYNYKDSVGSVLSAGWKGSLKLMGGAFQQAEATSRKVTFMSGFELAYERDRAKGKTHKEAFEVAMAEAEGLVYDTLFKYTEANRPPLMKNAFGSIALQFYTFPLQMYSYLSRSFFAMIPMLNAEGKKEAATAFFGTMSMTALFAGMVGLPMYSFTLGILEGAREAARELAGDDDDEDSWVNTRDFSNPLSRVNLDLWMRSYFIPSLVGPNSAIARTFGLTPDEAHYVTRMAEMGPMSTILDANIGTGTSLDNLLFRESRPTDSFREGLVQKVFDTALGPFGSMAARMGTAMDDLAAGDYQRASEGLLPAAIRGAVKSRRLEAEGLLTRQGAEIVPREFFHFGKLLGQAGGFSSTTADQLQKTLFKAKEFDLRLKKERGDLLTALSKASRDYAESGDDSDFLDALEKINTFNREKAIGDLYITSETIKTSLGNRAKAAAGSLRGIPPSDIQELAPFLGTRFDFLDTL